MPTNVGLATLAPSRRPTGLVTPPCGAQRPFTTPSRSSLLTEHSIQTTLSREKSFAGGTLQKTLRSYGSADQQPRGTCSLRLVDVRCGRLFRTLACDCMFGIVAQR